MRGKTPADLPQFTGLRGIAACLVLLGHVRTPVGLTLDFAVVDPLAKFGIFGVDIFFVLSGYILCHVYADRLTSDQGIVWEFFAARFARIYPLHVVTLFLMLGAYSASALIGVAPTETSGYSLKAVVLSLLLVDEWFGVVAPNPSSWSISVEFANYLYFPFVIPALAPLRRWYLPVIIVGTIIIFLTDSRLLRGTTEFMMGCAAFYMARDWPLRRTMGLTGLLFLAPFALANYGGSTCYWFAALCFTGLVFLLSSGAADDFFGRVCASRPLVFLGDISLSVYLLQWFVWVGWKHLLARSPFFVDNPYAVSFAAVVSVIVASAISYYTFERPTRIWLRKRLVAPWSADSAIRQA